MSIFPFTIQPNKKQKRLFSAISPPNVATLTHFKAIGMIKKFKIRLKKITEKMKKTRIMRKMSRKIRPNQTRKMKKRNMRSL